MIRRRAMLLAAVAAPLAARADNADWDGVRARGHGQTVYFNAWGGDERTNAFIAWADTRMRALYGVTVRHVRLTDTAEAVARVVAEKAAGRGHGGSVDLVWINGPNFLAMRQAGLLFGSVLDRLPNAALVDRAGNPATVTDFTVPTDGMEVPWRTAQLVFVHDAARLPQPPRSMTAMRDYAAAHRGRLTHPTATDFMGATFLKQALLELAADAAALRRPADDAAYIAATAPLWTWYDATRPNLWHGGRDFPASGPAQASLFGDGEIDLYPSFDPAEAAGGIARGTLPATARAYVLDGGTLGNCSFVAIPFNAAHRDAALLLADFLLSPEAQAYAADPRQLGSPTVLALGRLPPADRARFEAPPHPPGLLTAAELGAPRQEPHPSWMTRLAADWERRVLR